MIIAIISNAILVTPKLVAVCLFQLTVLVTFSFERGTCQCGAYSVLSTHLNITKFSDLISCGFGIAVYEYYGRASVLGISTE